MKEARGTKLAQIRPTIETDRQSTKDDETQTHQYNGLSDLYTSELKTIGRLDESTPTAQTQKKDALLKLIKLGLASSYLNATKLKLLCIMFKGFTISIQYMSAFDATRVLLAITSSSNKVTGLPYQKYDTNLKRLSNLDDAMDMYQMLECHNLPKRELRFLTILATFGNKQFDRPTIDTLISTIQKQDQARFLKGSQGDQCNVKKSLLDAFQKTNQSTACSLLKSLRPPIATAPQHS